MRQPFFDVKKQNFGTSRAEQRAKLEFAASF